MRKTVNELPYFLGKESLFIGKAKKKKLRKVYWSPSKGSMWKNSDATTRKINTPIQAEDVQNPSRLWKKIKAVFVKLGLTSRDVRNYTHYGGNVKSIAVT